MRLLLLYYTGTYNTRYIANLLKSKLSTFYDVDMVEVNSDISKIDISIYDIIGIGYPIYAFNVPKYFLKYLKKLYFPKDKKYFIFKNSGETYEANDTSSLSLIKFLKKKKIEIKNEYHFVMPYNIHFRFEDNLIKEMLDKDDKLAQIVVYDLLNENHNIKNYKFRYKIVTNLLKIQAFGGTVNSFFYKVDSKKCTKCKKCIQECPVKNIYLKNNRIKFSHRCLMCMRCSFYCPTNAIKIGFLESWKVNGQYDFKRIKSIEHKDKIITKNTRGFFKCYIKTFADIDRRYEEIKNTSN